MNRWSLLWLLGLYVLVIVLALMVVSNRHHARQLFAEMKELEQERDDRSADWSRLKLEQGARLNQVRVETQARDKLRMQKPSADNIKVLHE